MADDIEKLVKSIEFYAKIMSYACYNIKAQRYKEFNQDPYEILAEIDKTMDTINAGYKELRKLLVERIEK